MLSGSGFFLRPSLPIVPLLVMPTPSTLLLVTAAIAIPLLWGVLVDLVFERLRNGRASAAGETQRRQDDQSEARADDWVI